MTKKKFNTFINDLLFQTNIIDIISSKTYIKKQGKNYRGLCPFHNENHPSLTVSEEKQFYYCFGCGAHGNSIDFLINFDKLTFIEAIKKLAKIQKSPFAFYQNKHSLLFEKKNNHIYEIMNKINIFYYEILKKKKFIQANNYLKLRGINEKTIENFSIGFSPPYKNNLIEIFNNQKKTLKHLKFTGMITKNNKLLHDIFRSRIMFPIRNNYGQIIAFGGRSINNNKPKYLNSAETEIFNKKNCLYGLYEIKKPKKKINKIIIVEGYIDVITLTQFNIKYVVATLGTNITEQQIQLLYHNTDHIICCYDGDNTGKQASWNFLQKTLPYITDQRQLSFINLPNKEDPDSIIRKKGAIFFETLIKNAQPFFQLMFKSLMIQLNIKKDELIKPISILLPLINKIPGKITRIYLKQQLKNKMGIWDINQFNKVIQTKKNNLLIKNIKHTIIQTITGLLIQNPQLFKLINIKEELKSSTKPEILFLIKIIKICNKYPNIKTGQLLEQFREKKYYKKLKILSTWQHMFDIKIIDKIFIDSLTALKKSILQDKKEMLILKERIHGLNKKEKHEIWLLNQLIIKKQ